MKLIIVIVALCTVAAGRFMDMPAQMKEWNNYKAKYGKAYDSADEEQHRLSVFLENKKNVEAHNANYKAGQETFTMALNKFSDLTFEEFRDQYLQNNNDGAKMQHPKKSIDIKNNYPASVDWRLNGTVTPVKDQGKSCSSFSFAGVATVEAVHAMETSDLVSLSVQQVLDCSHSTGQYGPDNLNDVFNYIMDSEGLDIESFYPYTGKVDTCKFDPAHTGATISGDTIFASPFGDERLLQWILSESGPLAVSIEVESSFYQYSSGVYYGADCSGNFTSINHGALLVGYDTCTENGTEYYIVKNSWGTDWGEDGYVRMSRNRNNNCCISSIYGTTKYPA